MPADAALACRARCPDAGWTNAFSSGLGPRGRCALRIERIVLLLPSSRRVPSRPGKDTSLPPPPPTHPPEQAFQPSSATLEMMQEHVQILCVGAGGLGCELLKGLALSGFRRITVIDMDTVDVSNLNRQFLFGPGDIGLPKATAAARAIMNRIEGCVVTPVVGRLEDQPPEWWYSHELVVLGLDSVEARARVNEIVATNRLRWEDVPEAERVPGGPTVRPVPNSVHALVDGGSQGFQGNFRVIVPGQSACFECTRYLFPPQVVFPLCTLAETPRSPEHCVEWARLVLWDKPAAEGGAEEAFPAPNGEEGAAVFDADVPEHLDWVYKRALARAEPLGIGGVTPQFVTGVVKNIVPALASTNAVVAAQCSLEVLKLATGMSTYLRNYVYYNGTDGVYAPREALERDPDCPQCSPGVVVSLPRDATVAACLRAIAATPEAVAAGVTTPGESIESGTRTFSVLYDRVRGNVVWTAGALTSRYIPLDGALASVTVGDAGDNAGDRHLLVHAPGLGDKGLRVRVAWA